MDERLAAVEGDFNEWWAHAQAVYRFPPEMRKACRCAYYAGRVDEGDLSLRTLKELLHDA